MATELTPIDVARNKILALQETLLNKSPTLPHQLREVHNLLKQTPECVTLFKDEPEMAATLVAALERHTNTELISAKIAKPKAAALKKATLDDLGF